MLKIMAKSRARRQAAARILAALTARAREPVFFEQLGVADTIDGRFDLVALHAVLVLERLKALEAGALAQDFTDALFISFDEGLRDLGVSDIGMGRRLKNMAKAFYGRLDAYRKAQSLDALGAAVHRNLYRERAGTVAPARSMARYMVEARKALAAHDLAGGAVCFGPLPEPAGLP